ncbi:hypothetical protein M514_09695 [Trichuris suis]|uniref:Uncharacterized protein n=1 Tax=Trichuris suis TaxID=68888 RepID=A0A085LWT2_9BILA|nr:hypothetical protein M513_09695 [Trichuris suis]KFD63644.1 hypothetical protein M514_09695 [Trichuris suis]
MFTKKDGTPPRRKAAENVASYQFQAVTNALLQWETPTGSLYRSLRSVCCSELKEEEPTKQRYKMVLTQRNRFGRVLPP